MLKRIFNAFYAIGSSLVLLFTIWVSPPGQSPHQIVLQNIVKTGHPILYTFTQSSGTQKLWLKVDLPVSRSNQNAIVRAKIAPDKELVITPISQQQSPFSTTIGTVFAIRSQPPSEPGAEAELSFNWETGARLLIELEGYQLIHDSINVQWKVYGDKSHTSSADLAWQNLYLWSVRFVLIIGLFGMAWQALVTHDAANREASTLKIDKIILEAIRSIRKSELSAPHGSPYSSRKYRKLVTRVFKNWLLHGYSKEKSLVAAGLLPDDIINKGMIAAGSGPVRSQLKYTLVTIENKHRELVKVGKTVSSWISILA